MNKPFLTNIVVGGRQCRFCLGEEGEDPELGRLINPCLCRDTVHTECLQTWRATNAQAFYSCNVCKWSYKFQRVTRFREIAVRLCAPLWPIALVSFLSAALGFIPVFGHAGSNIGLHMLNGLAAVGLLYLSVIVVAFNWQYLRYTSMVSQAATTASLPSPLRLQLWTHMLARCVLLAMFFGFCMVYFFPYSGLMGVLAMALASPPAVKELGDRLIRRLEAGREVQDVTSDMVAQGARERADDQSIRMQGLGEDVNALEQEGLVEGSAHPPLLDVEAGTSDGVQVDARTCDRPQEPLALIVSTHIPHQVVQSDQEMVPHPQLQCC
ncbi:hypothetical protein CEUSTIGMA_g11473.t1 [Chlamydomonas eustigma]|uniref:RING-CH-type domain-containing protein n=1 Tax=Chlamydomonas eustigma TaxID=1157962 RepID=A0A250XMA1_9CHLO|nr:hypothetical protein CEUSTIGMA_g11473.t1 [Chlamydomonas eustigma]|eukprot:GAX84049.1 hypothetical protein CEUSTIGMA_g11473.t1 [Chlamydomonas eustigma]